VYPLLISVYHENYPKRLRGRLFAWAAMVNMGSSALFHWIFGLALGRHSLHYREVLLAFGAASLLSAWALARMPSPPHPEAPKRTRSFLDAFRWIRHDRAFAYMLLVWFAFGFANFLVAPLKVIYLTEPRYGLVYSAATVALIIGIIPECMRITSTPVWAWLFDHRNFISVRTVLNVILLGSMATFFLSRGLGWLYASAFLDGLFSGGANIAWALWVTQVAPPGHTAEYMAVNQFFTGIRGMVGVFLGIRLATLFGMRAVAWGALSLVLLSIVMMIPARRNPKWVKLETAGAEGANG
jgi:MFS family permease